MVSERQAFSAWQDVLEQEIGVDEAAIVVDRLDAVVRRRDLDRVVDRIDRLAADIDERFDRVAADVDERFDRFAAHVDERFDRQATEFDGKLDRLSNDVDARFDSQANRLMAAWRRDLLLIAVPQFVALVAILMGVGR